MRSSSCIQPRAPASGCSAVLANPSLEGAGFGGKSFPVLRGVVDGMALPPTSENTFGVFKPLGFGVSTFQRHPGSLPKPRTQSSEVLGMGTGRNQGTICRSSNTPGNSCPKGIALTLAFPVQDASEEGIKDARSIFCGRSDLWSLKLRHHCCLGRELRYHLAKGLLLAWFHLPQRGSNVSSLQVKALLKLIRGLVYPSCKITSKKGCFKA